MTCSALFREAVDCAKCTPKVGRYSARLWRDFDAVLYHGQPRGAVEPALRHLRQAHPGAIAEVAQSLRESNGRMGEFLWQSGCHWLSVEGTQRRLPCGGGCGFSGPCWRTACLLESALAHGVFWRYVCVRADRGRAGWGLADD